MTPQQAPWTAGDQVPLDECPPGLFLFGSTLCFRSEYSTPRESWVGGYQPDAYVVSSGEYFWGGAKTSDERSKLLVQPIDESAAAAAPQMAEALVKARNALACLIFDPKKPTLDAWPVANSGDAECLQKAYVALQDAITDAALTAAGARP